MNRLMGRHKIKWWNFWRHVQDRNTHTRAHTQTNKHTSTDRHIRKYTNTHTHIYRRTHPHTHAHKHAHTSTDRQTDRHKHIHAHTHRQTDRQTDRQDWCNFVFLTWNSKLKITAAKSVTLHNLYLYNFNCLSRASRFAYYKKKNNKKKPKRTWNSYWN